MNARPTRRRWKLALGSTAIILLMVRAAFLADAGQHFRAWWFVVFAAVGALALLAAGGGRRASRGHPRLAIAARLALVAAMLAALGYISSIGRRPPEPTTVVYVLDRSASIPTSEHWRQLDYVNANAAALPANTSSALIIFGESVSIEALPQTGMQISQIRSSVGPSTGPAVPTTTTRPATRCCGSCCAPSRKPSACGTSSNAEYAPPNPPGFGGAQSALASALFEGELVLQDRLANGGGF